VLRSYLLKLAPCAMRAGRSGLEMKYLQCAIRAAGILSLRHRVTVKRRRCMATCVCVPGRIRCHCVSHQVSLRESSSGLVVGESSGVMRRHCVTHQAAASFAVGSQMSRTGQRRQRLRRRWSLLRQHLQRPCSPLPPRRVPLQRHG
jgi:hypothetical protein